MRVNSKGEKSSRFLVPLKTAMGKWVSQFRLLKKWRITIDPSTKVGGHMHINKKNKVAEIERGPNHIPAEHYVYHELLHLAIAEMGSSHTKQEILVQDITDHVQGACPRERYVPSLEKEPRNDQS